MKLIVLFSLVAFAASAKLGYGRDDSFEVVKLLRDERQQTPDSYAFEFESEDGIKRSESGDRLDSVENQPIGSQGSYSFRLPNGEEFYLKFVADENGFQPESPFLPVAPAFPHPIPQFVLDQIEKAKREDEEAARSGGRYYDSDEK